MRRTQTKGGAPAVSCGRGFMAFARCMYILRHDGRRVIEEKCSPAARGVQTRCKCPEQRKDCLPISAKLFSAVPLLLHLCWLTSDADLGGPAGGHNEVMQAGGHAFVKAIFIQAEPLICHYQSAERNHALIWGHSIVGYIVEGKVGNRCHPSDNHSMCQTRLRYGLQDYDSGKP